MTSWSEAELRQALALSCRDALLNTEPLTREAKAAICEVLRRLVLPSPVTLADERAALDLLLEHCVLVAPFDASFAAKR